MLNVCEYVIKNKSTNTNKKFLKYSEKISFIKDWKEAEALTRPKGTTRNPNKLWLVLKAILWICARPTLIWWYPDLKSNLEKIVAPWSSSNSSSTIGIGYLSFYLIHLSDNNLQCSIHILHVLFLLTTITGEASGLWEALLIPDSSSHSIDSLGFFCMWGYLHPLTFIDLAIVGIRWSYVLVRGNPLDSQNTSLQSSNEEEIPDWQFQWLMRKETPWFFLPFSVIPL